MLEVCVDGENVEAIAELQARHVVVRPTAFNRFKDAAVEAVRDYLANGLLYISADLTQFKREMFRLHTKRNSEDIAKENDHGPDALLAFAAHYMLKTKAGQGVVVSGRMRRR